MLVLNTQKRLGCYQKNYYKYEYKVAYLKKGLPMKQHQTKVSRLTRDVMIFDLMNTMGWTRSRAIAAIEELERTHLVSFPEAGGLRLQVVGGY